MKKDNHSGGRRPLFRWRVHHTDHVLVEVVGANRYDAVVAAAKLWGVPWTPIARACIFEQIEKVSAREM